MISAIILTKNEEKNIAECLESLSWCDERIIIDDHSSDKTVDIAKKMGVKVFLRTLDGDFAAQRNFGLEKAEGDWILFIDADERVNSALWFEIMERTNNPLDAYDAYYLKRKDVIWGKELQYGEVGNLKLLRLGKKGAGLWEGRVHEQWKVKGNTFTLNNALMHYPHQTVGEFLKEINYYTDLRSSELYTRKVRVAWWAILLYPSGKFVINYFFKRGFLDGLPGLVFALLMSFHSFLVRSKLWLLWQKEKSK